MIEKQNISLKKIVLQIVFIFWQERFFAKKSMNFSMSLRGEDRFWLKPEIIGFAKK